MDYRLCFYSIKKVILVCYSIVSYLIKFLASICVSREYNICSKMTRTAKLFKKKDKKAFKSL